MRRKKMSRRSSRKSFRKGAVYTHRKNYNPGLSRGGIRL